MVAFGGGAPLHAGRLAQKLGIERVVIPAGAGVGSAIGFLLAPIAYEVVRSLPVDFRSFDATAVNSMLDGMRREAESVVRGGAAQDAALSVYRIVELRYAGQGHCLRIELDDGPITKDQGAMLKGPVRGALPGCLRSHDRRPRHPERLLVRDRVYRHSGRFPGNHAGGTGAAPGPCPGKPGHL